ncbi:MAG TPA: hypothetical protein DD473_00150 [Planctomycetaceae bacterium]|nr:hypothetical protein [Planctomycetaceae bacterium]|tara:strand:+ start:160 stop:627 length:468 start_codon:yes stop_codon:yes gene_type:complete
MIDQDPTANVPLDEAFEKNGLQLRYPGYWQLEYTEEGETSSVTILTETTAFWMVSIVPGTATADEVLDAALESYQEEYDEFDVYERKMDKSNSWMTQELEVVCHDLITNVALNAIELEECSLFVLYQGEDADLDEKRSTFDAITGSLRVIPEEIG